MNNNMSTRNIYCTICGTKMNYIENYLGMGPCYVCPLCHTYIIIKK